VVTTPDYHQSATDVVATFPARENGDRQFLNCWIPGRELTNAIASSMARHGDPASWWDGLQEHLT
jgi:hypothetical protein